MLAAQQPANGAPGGTRSRPARPARRAESLRRGPWPVNECGSPRRGFAGYRNDGMRDTALRGRQNGQLWSVAGRC